MIIRKWSCRARHSKAHKYPEYFRTQIMPELRKQKGFLGGFLSQRSSGDDTEFLVLTRWQSVDAVRAFAAPVLENVVIDTGALATVDTYDDRVRQYEVLEDIQPVES